MDKKSEVEVSKIPKGAPRKSWLCQGCPTFYREEKAVVKAFAFNYNKSLVVTEALTHAKKTQYAVTHTSSGLAIPGVFDSVEKATCFMESMTPLASWENSKADLALCLKNLILPTSKLVELIQSKNPKDVKNKRFRRTRKSYEFSDDYLDGQSPTLMWTLDSWTRKK